MGKKKNACVIKGVTYYSPKTAGDIWGMKYQAVTKACKEERVVNAAKDTSDQWIIPSTSPKPLEKEQIKHVLICILSLKNRPDPLPADIKEKSTLTLFQYLRDCKYIEPFNEISNRIPYEAVITQKGMELVFQTPSIKINWLNIAETTVKCIAIIVDIAKLFSNHP